MNVYLAGSPVTLTVPLKDRGGNALVVSAVSYRVVDQAGEEVLPYTALTSFVSGAQEAVIEVPGAVNVLAAMSWQELAEMTWQDAATRRWLDMASLSAAREARTVEMALTVSGNVVLLTQSYILEPADVLVPGLNSFQTLVEAEITALDVTGLDGWLSASERDKIAALIDARAKILQLRFSLLDDSLRFGQDSLFYTRDGGAMTLGTQWFLPEGGGLESLTLAQFQALPARFRTALYKAQVAEADGLLGGDPVDVRRQEGLIRETIGEVTQVYRDGHPVNMTVSRRALRYLAPFVSLTRRVGRG